MNGRNEYVPRAAAMSKGFCGEGRGSPKVRARYGSKAVETGYTFGTGSRGKPQRDQDG